MTDINEILILGALPKTEERKKLYESIITICKDYTKNINSPIDTANFKGNDQEKYERALQKVRDASLIIGEQSEPSTGQGMEVEYAATLNKPVVVVAESGSKVSGLIKGCPAVKDIIMYDSMNDLESKLTQFLEAF